LSSVEIVIIMVRREEKGGKMKKRLLLLITVLIFSILPSSASAEEPIKVYIDGKKINFFVNPILESGRTIVEFRPVFEKLGFKVQWDDTNEIVKGKRLSDGLELEFKIGQPTASIGYHPLHVLPLAVPARTMNGHTLVPLRFVAEVSGKNVNWNGDDNTIKIYGSKSVSFNQNPISPANNTKLPSAPSFKMTRLITPINSSTYVVKKGDNLYRIAATHYIPLSTLMQMNNLASDEIHVGQTLVLPPSSTASDWSNSAVSSPSPSTSLDNSNVKAASLATDGSTTLSMPHPTHKPLYPADFVFSANDPLQGLIRPLLGTPYVWGGSTPAGFDCSGFTKYVFQELGVTLPRVSADQSTQGQAIDPTQMQEGDLLFFDADRTGTVNHVAIYLGNGYLAHASIKSVVIDTLHHLRRYPLLGVKRFPLPLPSTLASVSTLPNP
jgi:peptidoglycan DL-endopeptidase LytE